MEVTVLVEYKDCWRYMYIVCLSGNFVCRINPMECSECSVMFVFDQEFNYIFRDSLTNWDGGDNKGGGGARDGVQGVGSEGDIVRGYWLQTCQSAWRRI